MASGNKFKKIIIPIVIIVTAFAARWVIVQSRPVPKKIIKENIGPLADYITVKKDNYNLIVSGTGTVEVKQEASITPQVSGKISWLSPHFTSGGHFRKGALFFKIESIDYELALRQSEANFERLENEYKRSDSLFEKGMINEHDFEKALDDYKVANAKLKQAKLDLERTEIRAPFNCLIRSEEIDIGQYVRSGNSVGMIAGTDTAEILVPIPLEDISWIEIPEQGKKGKASTAEIVVESGSRRFIWQGITSRTLGEINTRDRMARVVVDVSDPYQLKNTRKGDNRPDLAIGTFVEVNLKGKLINDIFMIPRKVLQKDSSVWTIGENNLLKNRKITILRREKEMLLVSEGLEDGDRILVTSIPGAAEGMVVRPFDKGVSQ